MPSEMRLAVPVAELPSFAALCGAAGWPWVDTGERVTGEAGLDAEAVVVVSVPARATSDGGAVVAVAP